MKFSISCFLLSNQVYTTKKLINTINDPNGYMVMGELTLSQGNARQPVLTFNYYQRMKVSTEWCIFLNVLLVEIVSQVNHHNSLSN